MTQSFRWLHLTDLHWGHEDQEKEWSNFDALFYEDMERVLDNCIKAPIDAVFFTGDLVNRGTSEEFQGLNDELEELWRWFASRNQNPWFLPVPGNHDLSRPKPNSQGLGPLTDLRELDKASPSFWNKSAYQDAHLLLEQAFENYQKWWENLPALIRKPEKMQQGFFPGEFAASLEKEGTRIGVVGLNSAAFHFSDTKPGQLKLDDQQMVAACSSKYSKWFQSHRACFLLTHHPPSWFSTESKEAYYRVYQTNRFAAHLFGHVHEHEEEYVLWNGEKNGRRCVTGLSLFGRESWTGKEKDIERRYGYSFGELNFSGSEGEIRFWPRQLKINKKSRNWNVDKADDWDFDQEKRDEGTNSGKAALLPQKPLTIEWPKSSNRNSTHDKYSTIQPGFITQKKKTHHVGATYLETQIAEALNDILNNPCFSSLWSYWQEELHSGAPWGETMVFKANFLDAMSALTTSLHKVRLKDAFQNQPDQSKKMLEQIQEIPCWLVLTALIPKWQPKIPETAPKEFHELMMFIPGIYSLSIEVGVTRLRLESDKKGKALPAKFVFDKDAIQKFKVPGAFELEIPPLKVPDRLDYLNKIKRSLFRAVCPDEEQEFLYEKVEGGSQLKPFSTDMNIRLRTELISTFKKDWLVTPFLMINPLTSPLMEFPPEVIKQLKEDLNPPELNSDIDPIHIVCLHGEGEMWKEGIDEESVFVELKRFYKELNNAYKTLEQ